MIHRNQRAAQPRRRGHHRAGGAGAVVVEAGAARAGARAGEAEQPSEMGAPGVAGQLGSQAKFSFRHPRSHTQNMKIWHTLVLPGACFTCSVPRLPRVLWDFCV